MLKINVTTAEAVVTETELITAGRKGLRCAFSFSEDWAGLAKTAIVQGAATRDIALLATNEIVVPAECVNKAQFPLKIGVYGALPDGTIAIPTIWASFGKVLPGAKPSDIPPDELTPDVVAQIQEAASNALYLARNVQSMADSGELDGVSPAVTVTSITGGHNIKITDRDHPNGQSFDVPDGTDGVSPGVTVTSITGGHTVTITDEDHPGGQSFNVMDGQGAVVDATLSNAGEAADAAETGKVKAMAGRHDAELLAITPVSSSSNYTWYAGTAWSSSGTNTTNSLSARSAKKEASPGTVIVNASRASANGKTLYIHVVEWNGSTFVKRSYIRPGGFVTIGAATDTYALNFAYDSGQSAPNMDAATLSANFGVRVVTKPSGGGGGGISPYTSNPAALGTASPGSSDNYARGDHVHPKPSASDIGAYALPSGGIPASDLASAVQTSLGKADTALQSAPVSSVNGQTGAVTVAEPYFVTYSTSDMTTWTCDKTFAQITAAMAAGMQIVMIVSAGGTPVSQNCDVLLSTDGDVYCIEFWTRYARNGWYRIIHNDDDSIEFYDAYIDSQDVDAVASDQGVSEAGKFLVVGNDGNVTTMTLATWQGGNY